MYLLALAPLTIMIIVKASEVVVDEDIQNQHDKEQWKASFYYIPTHTTNSNEDSLDKDGLPTFNELKVALNKYRDMTDDILYQLSRAHEVASRTEQILYPNHDAYSPTLLSSKLEHKIKRSAETLEENMIVLERLLKPFERLDEARGNEGGCGLGLSIADRIAKAHDGKLELISNKKDKGLEAKITIPIIRA